MASFPVSNNTEQERSNEGPDSCTIDEIEMKFAVPLAIRW